MRHCMSLRRPVGDSNAAVYMYMFRKVDADQPTNKESNSLCGAVHCSALQCIAGRKKRTARLCVAVCSSVMQFVAVYCRESTSLFSTSRINKSHDRLQWLFCGIRPAIILCIFVASLLHLCCYKTTEDFWMPPAKAVHMSH